MSSPKRFKTAPTVREILQNMVEFESDRLARQREFEAREREDDAYLAELQTQTMVKKAERQAYEDLEYIPPPANCAFVEEFFNGPLIDEIDLEKEAECAAQLNHISYINEKVRIAKINNTMRHAIFSQLRDVKSCEDVNALVVPMVQLFESLDEDLASVSDILNIIHTD